MTCKLAPTELGSLLHTQSGPIPVEIDVADLPPLSVAPDHSAGHAGPSRFAHTVSRASASSAAEAPNAAESTEAAAASDSRTQATRPSRVQPKPRAAVHPDSDRPTRQCDPSELLGPQLAEGSSASSRVDAAPGSKTVNLRGNSALLTDGMGAWAANGGVLVAPPDDLAAAASGGAASGGAASSDADGGASDAGARDVFESASSRAATESDPWARPASMRPRARGTRRPVVAIPILAKGSNTEIEAIGDSGGYAARSNGVPEAIARQRSRGHSRRTEMPDARVAIAMAVGVWLAVVIVAWLMFASA